MEPWKRTLAATAVSQIFSILGFSFVTPFMPLFIQQLGIHGTSHITLWAALLSSGTAVTMAISSPIWGAMADRHGRKIMVIRASFSACVIIGLMALAQSVYQLLILRALQGMFTGTVSASQALVASQAPRQRLGFSLGVMQTSVFVGNSMGPFVGGLVADALGFRPSFLAGACLLFISGLVVVLFAREEFVPDKTKAQPSLRAGLADAARTPALMAMVGTVFAVNFGVTVVYPILPQFVQLLQGVAHAATTTGLILALAGVAGAISSLTTGYFAERLGYKRVLVVAAVCAGIFSAPQFFVSATWQLLVLRVLTGFAMGAVMPSSSALVASLVPPEKRGTAYGLTASANSIGFAAGPLTAAAVVAVADMRAVFLTAAVLMGIIALWVSLRVPGTRLQVAEIESPGPGTEVSLPVQMVGQRPPARRATGDVPADR